MKRNDIMLILVPSLIFVVIWILFSVYHSYINSTIPEVVNIQINPITPTFDTKTIGLIKTREQISPLYQVSPVSGSVNIPSSPSAQPVSIITPTPTGTGSQQQASTGGNLTP